MAVPEDNEQCDKDSSQSKCIPITSTKTTMEKEMSEDECIKKANQYLEGSGGNQIIEDEGDDNIDLDEACRTECNEYKTDEKLPFWDNDVTCNAIYKRSSDCKNEGKCRRMKQKKKVYGIRILMIAFLIIGNYLSLISDLISYTIPLITHSLVDGSSKTRYKSNGPKSFMEESIRWYTMAYFAKFQSVIPTISQEGSLKSLFQIRQTSPFVQIVFPAYTLKDYFCDLEANPNMSRNEKMKYDMLRTSTFSNFPPNCPISTMRLVKAGFYYDGYADEVTCFRCGVRYRSWKQDDDPIAIHKALSPTCPFINNPRDSLGDPNMAESSDAENGQTVIYSREVQDNERDEGQNILPMNRQDTFSEIKRNMVRTMEQPSNQSSLTRPGIVSQVCTASHDQQNLRMVDDNVPTSSGSNPAVGQQTDPTGQLQPTSHQGSQGTSQTSQTRRHSSAITPGNRHTTTKSTKDTLEPLGISIEQPKYPQYAVLSSRISSFKNWPKQLTHNPEDMARAGFIYEGTNDFTRCFFCAGGLRDWEPEDNPWIEHARWYQNCTFLRQCKGENFIHLVQQGNIQGALDKLEGRTVHMPAKSMKQSEEPNIFNIPAVISVLEMGYDKNIVKNTVSKLSEKEGIDKLKAEDILQLILETEEKEISGSETTSSEVIQLPNSNGTCISFSNDQQNNSDEGNLAVDHETLLAENRELREQQICKICMDEGISIVFLPCGHMVTCVNCAPALRKCPLCRRFVKGTVKAILS